MRSVAGSLLADVDCDFEVALPTKDPGLSMSHRRNLLLIFKECLHNISRHAGATRVDIGLTVRERTLTLQVSDNGRGFSPDAAHGGQGLDTMKSRASTMGADIDITSEPGEGSTLTLILKMTRTRRGQD